MICGTLVPWPEIEPAFPTLQVALQGGSLVKNLPANAGDIGLIPGLQRSPGKGNGNPLQYSCLENPTNRGAWWAIYSPWGRKELDMTEQLSTHTWQVCVLNHSQGSPYNLS